MPLEFSPNIALEVTDRDRAVALYRDVLGMRHVGEENGEAVLKSGPMTFYVGESPQGRVYFEFKTTDLAQTRAALLNAGCELTQEHSAKSLMFADPFGLRFHVYEAE